MRQRIHVQPSDGLCGVSVYAAGGSHRAHATELVNAAVGSGTGHETNNLTFTLGVPANAYVGAYTSTWTFTLSSGP